MHIIHSKIMVISEGLHLWWLEKELYKECILNMLSTSFFILHAAKNAKLHLKKKSLTGRSVKAIPREKKKRWH